MTETDVDSMTEAEEIDSWIHWASARIDNDREKLAHRNATIARLSGVIEEARDEAQDHEQWLEDHDMENTREWRRNSGIAAILAKAETPDDLISETARGEARSGNELNRHESLAEWWATLTDEQKRSEITASLAKATPKEGT